MDPTIRTPQVASTITPPRHVLVTTERGKLSRGERVALAGLSSFQGGTAYLGAVIAGSSARGVVDGALVDTRRDRLNSERFAATPLNPMGTSADAQAGLELCHAVTSWGAESVCWAFLDADTGRWLPVRDEADGDEELPRVTETCRERKTRESKAARAAAKSAARAKPVRDEGPRIEQGDARAKPARDDRDDVVRLVLASMGHKGKITPRLRSLALDVLASRQQRSEYIG